MANEEVNKKINVSLRVIADLSQGLYRTPADALKELISNAYDADSPKVEITFSKDYSTITVMDWGSGMTIEKFVATMEMIGGSSKRSSDTNFQQKTNSGRPIVGRIGIGLLSVSQLASTLEIESTTEGSSIGFRARIEFDQFVSDEARKTKITELYEEDASITIGQYHYKKISGVENKLSFTKLILSDVNRFIRQNLLSIEESEDTQSRQLGINLHSTGQLVEWMDSNHITKPQLHEYDRIVWELGVLCPVPYLPKAISVVNKIDTSSNTKDFSKFLEDVNTETHFHLFIDGIECFKPILFPSDSDRNYSIFFNLLFMNGIDNEKLKYRDYEKSGDYIEKMANIKGYFYFQRPKIWPPELQGILIRVRNVAVGFYDSTFLTYKRHEGFKFSQLTGEILIDGLDEALNIDRSSFRETEPSFIALREKIHNYLGKIVFPGIKAYATTERTDRSESAMHSDVLLFNRKFSSLDPNGRKIKFSDKQENILDRAKNALTFSLRFGNKKKKSSALIYKVIAFLEATLSRKLDVKERDDLFKKLSIWLEEFE